MCRTCFEDMLVVAVMEVNSQYHLGLSPGLLDPNIPRGTLNQYTEPPLPLQDIETGLPPSGYPAILIIIMWKQGSRHLDTLLY